MDADTKTNKRATPMLDPIEDIVANALGDYIEDLKLQIESLKRQVAQLQLQIQHEEIA